MTHNKYVKNKNIVELCGKNSTSHSSTWRGIAHGVKLLLEGVVWRVEDESLMAFWTEKGGLGRDCRYGFAMIRGEPGEWRSWFLANLKNKNLFNGSPMCVYFAFTIWFIWKWRCKSIFDPNFKLHPGPHIPTFGAKYVEGSVNRFISWCPPPSSWLKLNVDDSRSPLVCLAASGAIRDNSGQWLGGFILHKGISNTLEAELWGMVEYWIRKVMHIYREANKLADWMTKLGLQSDLGVKYLEDPSAGCLEIIADDATGCLQPKACIHAL
ncbi:hypothetical protein ACOSQ4_025837 [Xanthoceras sorbifolium]